MKFKSIAYKVEKWKSDQNNEEIHWFRKEDGDDEWIYLIGYNPAFFSEEDIWKFINDN